MSSRYNILGDMELREIMLAPEKLTKRVALLCYVQCDWVLSGYFSQTLSAQRLSARGN